ncbi:MAG: aminoacyl-histidine dipeptidase [Bacteroidales bacterium]|nr:aminoacyl-histidine dipeptidase [Bacteroidales bacterium]
MKASKSTSAAAATNALQGLQPERLWHWFGEILRIPRPSKHEERISAWLAAWGKDHGLETQRDKLGNILIRKPASQGYEQSASVCLQAHMDMVCEKNSDKRFDFLTDAIQPVLKEGWLGADGTTLGADDGIGVATILAILEDDTLPHPPLEALITVDEETGLTGAAGLSRHWLKSEIMLNFDDEDEGEYCIGCAGGIDTTAEIAYTPQPTPAHHKAFLLKVSGLQGGHSGDDINRGRGCAIKLLNRILWEGACTQQMRLARFEGGNLRNAIAREAEAVVAVPEAGARAFKTMATRMAKEMVFELRSTEPGLEFEIREWQMPSVVVDPSSQERLLGALYACAHGVLAMSREIPNFVETSTNLASVKMADGCFRIATSQRSSSESAKHAAASKIEATFRLAGARVSHSDGYPGWTPNPDSRVLQVGIEVYRRLYGKEPVVRAIHAGLECGLIGQKYPQMDMISYGPTMRGVHSPDERIEIRTVEMFWQQTLEILKQLK